MSQLLICSVGTDLVVQGRPVISALLEVKARGLQVQGKPQQLRNTCLKIKYDIRVGNIVHPWNWSASFVHMRYWVQFSEQGRKLDIETQRLINHS